MREVGTVTTIFNPFNMKIPTPTLVGLQKAENLMEKHNTNRKFQKNKVTKESMRKMMEEQTLKKKPNKLGQAQVGRTSLEEKPLARILHKVLVDNPILGTMPVRHHDRHDHNSTRMMVPRIGKAFAERPGHRAMNTHRAALAFRETSAAVQMTLGADSGLEMHLQSGTAKNPRSTSGATSSRLRLGW